MTPAIKLWGRRNSSNVQKALWCCDELGLPVEQIDAGREFGRNKEATFLELNPNGLVPVLEVAQGSIWESNAIVRYLARLDPEQRLVPADPYQSAIAEQWMDWQLASLGPAFTPMFHGLVRQLPEKRDYAEIEKSRADTENLLAMLDGHLATNAYVAGAAFSFGDIPLGIYAYRWSTFEGIQRRPMVNLERWYGQLQEREPFRRHVMVGLA